ncbi:signal peptide peptidase SppA [uncultured Muribaculum sp.]|uniref:signal peptide peptidase SppA n=1 Tax=uncultured Muribaculum sp. TaxID=1918613 RepID=UPI002593C6B5|nr:signal peptide peptidase SppA [uncultured Muribaculum sp.]
MKQFFTYVLATIAGIWITAIIAIIGSILMAIIMMAAGMSSSTPSISSHSILHINLDGVIEERLEGRSIMDRLYGVGEDQLSLKDIVKSIRHAKDDSKIDGIFIDCKGGTGGSATIAYIREALTDFKESGKWVVAYGDAYSQQNYFVATAADSLWVNPVGLVDVHGVGGSLTFYKGLLDKLDVEVQVIKVGTYKSAVEPFILTEPSEANRQQIRSYITPIWNYITENIASSRGVSTASVNQWADSILITCDPKLLPGMGVATSLRYRHEAEEWMKEQTDRDKDQNLRLVSPSTYVNTIKDKKSSTRIAVLYATGDIVDNGNEGIVGNKMAPLILDLANDKKVDALVLRVNSGGGSAFASEQIWEALEQFKATGKPFYVSMGDVAASGGYYISCGADKIYCQPVTITGSIGIFGMIPSIKGFLNDKLGITTADIMTNPNANIGIINPMTPIQRAAMQKMIDRGYETFTTRCAEGRNMPIDSIKAIAEGRVWDGVTAKRIGLVDELGNLDDCIADLATANGYLKYELVEYPRTNKEWWEEILDEGTSIKQAMIRKELGAAAPYYDAVKKISKMEHVQCRMQEVVIE